jgi:uncharacterized protein with LGFP repeats
MFTSARRPFGSRTISASGARIRKGLSQRRLEIEGLEQRLVLSPISDKYAALGGPNGFLGQPTSPELVAPDGVGHYETFQGGDIFWTPTDGAHEVHGAILGDYANLGLETSYLGYPQTDETETGKGDGRYNRFDGGFILWSANTPASALDLHTIFKYASLGYEQGVLGYPTSNVMTIFGGGSPPFIPPHVIGYYNTFQNGEIVWNASTNQAFEVQGAIWGEYLATANEPVVGVNYSVQDMLGEPTGDEMDVPGVPGARMSVFQGGTIYWSPSTGAHVVYGAIGAEYNGLGGPAGYGLPTSDEANVPGAPGARVTNFQNGASIYWSAGTGAHEVHGAIAADYNSVGGPAGYGLPLTDEADVPGVPGARFNSFQNGGTIYWSAGTGAHEVHGAINAEYASIGGPAGVLGLPLSDETVAPGGVGRYNYFVGGGVYWSAQTGARASILFTPQFGAENAMDGGAYKLSSTSIFLIFWGSYWQGGANPQVNAIVNATSQVLNGPYLSGLKQYGSDGKAFYVNQWFDNSDPANGFSGDDLDNVVQNAVDDPNSTIPESDTPATLPIYVVITPPGIMSNDPNAAGYHNLQHDTDFPFDYDDMPEAWVGTALAADGSLNLGYTTTILSHEVAEGMSDPTSGFGDPITGYQRGITVSHGASWTGGGDNEIADAEAQNYTYLLIGVVVQSYWSQQDQAYIVPIGASGGAGAAAPPGRFGPTNLLLPLESLNGNPVDMQPLEHKASPPHSAPQHPPASTANPPATAAEHMPTDRSKSGMLLSNVDALVVQRGWQSFVDRADYSLPAGRVKEGQATQFAPADLSSESSAGLSSSAEKGVKELIFAGPAKQQQLLEPLGSVSVAELAMLTSLLPLS